MTTATTMPDTLDPGTLTESALQSLAEMRMLPSRILHESRLDQFDPDGHWRSLLSQSANPAPVHRHWSHAILAQIGIRENAQIMPRQAALPVALLPGETFERLACWLGLQLCASRLRSMIRKSELEPLLALPWANFVIQARRHGTSVHYPASRQWDASQIASRHVGLGACALLHACDNSGPDQALYRLLALKLPETQSWPDLPESDMLLHACLEFLNEHNRHDVSTPT